MRSTLALRAAWLALVAWSAGAGTVQAADKWGIDYEEATRLQATVVDILCELTGDCPDNCGGGTRQLGLLTADGTLIPAVKNFDPFAGAVNDLQPFCGQVITVDGLLVRNPAMTMFVVQYKKPAGGAWSRGNWFTRDWQKANGGNGAQWFRNDPTVKALIAEQGVFGIPGLEPSE